MRFLRGSLMNAARFLFIVFTLILLFDLMTEPHTYAAKKKKKPLAKNIIIMISDGWGFNHLEAASYWEYGKDARQIYNRFPFNSSEKVTRMEILTPCPSLRPYPHWKK